MPPDVVFTTLTKIKDSPNNKVKDIEKIFAAVNDHGSNAQISFLKAIDRSIGSYAHIQGIVAYRIRATASNVVAVDWNAEKVGSIVSAAAAQTGTSADPLPTFSSTQQIYTTFPFPDNESYIRGKHPGGLQTCGDIIVSAVEGVEGQANAWFNFHLINDKTGEITNLKHTVTIAPKASTAGLVWFKKHYIVAIAREGSIIDIYTQADSQDIYQPGGALKHCASWNLKDQPAKTGRSDWAPNKEWRGVEGGGNLFVSQNKLYFIAFQREKDLSGADWACLYRLNFDPDQVSNSFTITKCAERHLIFEGGGGFGPHCRWGASANISDNGNSMSFVVTSRGTKDLGRKSINTPSLISFCW